MVDLAMSIFQFLTKFVIFWHPWHPWVCVRSVYRWAVWKWNLKQIEAIPPSVRMASVVRLQTLAISEKLIRNKWLLYVY